jgi:hypothetical protein
LISTNYTVVFRDVIFFVWYRSAILKTILISSRSWRNAVSAKIKISAFSALQVISGVLFARAVWNTMLVSIFVD